MTSDQDVSVASTETDAEAVRAVERHHAELSGALTVLVDALIDQVRRGAVADGGGDGDPDLEPARSGLSAFCTDQLLPHASAEEVALYPAAASDARARLLVEAMIGEHRTLSHLVDELARTTDPLQAVAVAGSIRTLFGSHLAKENDLILPLVAASPNLSLAAVLSGMHELLGDGEQPSKADHNPGAPHRCECAEGDSDASPVLDVRDVPHAIRHATVFGAIGAVPRGGSLLLVAPHDPVPLLQQLEQREPGVFSVTYQERGPQAWRLRLTRVG